MRQGLPEGVFFLGQAIAWLNFIDVTVLVIVNAHLSIFIFLCCQINLLLAIITFAYYFRIWLHHFCWTQLLFNWAINVKLWYLFCTLSVNFVYFCLIFVYHFSVACLLIIKMAEAIVCYNFLIIIILNLFCCREFTW